MSLFETMEPCAWHGSWAVWGSWDAAPPFDRHGNLRFPMHETQHFNKLHGRAVIIGLNPAGDGQPPLRIPSHEWTNFHWPGKHNDHFLATAFCGTWLWGCYMTDLVPGTHQSKSAEVNPGDRDVEAFMQEVSLLGEPDQLFVCLGDKTYNALSGSLPTDSRVVKVPHYSAANARVHKGRPEVYREICQQALAEYL